MSLSTELYERSYINKKNKIKNMIIFNIFYHHSYNDPFLDENILSSLRYKEYVEDKICSDHIWEKTEDGFENRSDFKYDEETKEITFNRNIIYVNNDYIHTNNTMESNLQYHKIKSWLFLLQRTNEEISPSIEKYKDIINQETEILNAESLYSDGKIQEYVSQTKQSIDNFFEEYGDFGKVMAIKWLNRLNDPYTNIKYLIEEYSNDIESADQFFESTIDDKTKKRKNTKEFDNELLKIIEIYSSRGNHFTNNYEILRKRKEESNVYGRTYVKLNNNK